MSGQPADVPVAIPSGASGPSGPSGRQPGSGRHAISGRGISGRSDSGRIVSGATSAGRVGARGGSSRGQLGLGMVEVPPVPYRDPAGAVLADPVVAERNRFCGSCGERVGRSTTARTGRTEGFCTRCGTEFSFVPKLRKGDLVAGQYEVLGCLAHGGLGWIYLARDHNVADRWVVLKGLLNSGDAEAHKNAAAERAFLAEVEHPNIVKIYNFVQHPDPKTGVPAGHIVMEYVGGKSLRDLIADHRAQGDGDDGLPVEQVVAYGLETLRALGYLHSKGLLYCDFKPENIIQSEELIKLIDLGGVRRIDDLESPVYTTHGYRVPEAELRGAGPSVSSDLYSVGRTLAALSFRFNLTREHPHSLPPTESVPVLAKYESYDRFLRRATHIEPELRFHSATDMAEQLTGVLREVLSDRQQRPCPAASTVFGPERFAAGDTGAATGDADLVLLAPSPADAAAALPVPLVDPGDPAAGLLAGLSTVRNEEVVETLGAVSEPTPESMLMLARALTSLGEHTAAEERLMEFGQRMLGDWRAFWYMAVLRLGMGAFDEARERFDEIYDHLPGEAAPKLGLALSCEGMGAGEKAARHYQTVWRTDHAYVSAAFGLARVRIAQGDRASAVEVLDTVPELSSLYLCAQMAAVTTLVTGRDTEDLNEEDLLDAGRRLERLGVPVAARHRLASRVLKAALEWWMTGGRPTRHVDLLGAAMDEDGLRRALERTYRQLARVGGGDHHDLIDRANATRPRTWV